MDSPHIRTDYSPRNFTEVLLIEVLTAVFLLQRRNVRVARHFPYHGNYDTNRFGSNSHFCISGRWWWRSHIRIVILWQWERQRVEYLELYGREVTVFANNFAAELASEYMRYDTGVLLDV